MGRVTKTRVCLSCAHLPHPSLFIRGPLPTNLSAPPKKGEVPSSLPTLQMESGGFHMREPKSL